MLNNLNLIYKNKSNKLMSTKTIGNRLINAVIANTLNVNDCTSITVYLTPEHEYTSNDIGTIYITNELVESDGFTTYVVECNYSTIECSKNELVKAIEMLVNELIKVDNKNKSYEKEIMNEIQAEEVETITAPEEVEEVTTQTQKTSIPENIKVYGTISEYFVEGEGWIKAKKATTQQVKNATQISVNYKVYNPEGVIVCEGTKDFSMDRYKALKKNTTHIIYHVKKNNGTKTKTGLNKFDTITLWSGRINPDKRKSTLNMLHNKYKDCKFIRV